MSMAFNIIFDANFWGTLRINNQKCNYENMDRVSSTSEIAILLGYMEQ